MSLKDQLIQLEACDSALAWVDTKSLKEAWRTCKRGDWMLWLAHKARVERRLIVLAACDCAETASIYWGDDNVLACVWAIDAARRGDDLDEISAAASAAKAAAEASYAYDVDAASYAYAAAYDASYAASYASSYASYAAAAVGVDAASYAAATDADADADARRESLGNSARIVRNRISYATINKALRGVQ